MTMLWLSIGTLLLLALWFLSLPLRRARAIHDWQQRFEADDHAEAQNLAVYERRLSALERARDRGEIDVARFEESRHELDRNLLEDTEARRRMPLRRPVSGRLMIPLVITAVIGASIIGYRWQGADGDLALYAAQQNALNTPGASMKTLVGRLEEEAGTQPDNPKVWSLLFPLYQKIGQPGQAIGALERLIELEGRRVDLLAQLAQIKFFVAGRSGPLKCRR